MQQAAGSQASRPVAHPELCVVHQVPKVRHRAACGGKHVRTAALLMPRGVHVCTWDSPSQTGIMQPDTRWQARRSLVGDCDALSKAPARDANGRQAL